MSNIEFHYKTFLEKFKEEIENDEFKEGLKKVQNIDLKYYTKIISIEEIKDLIKEYENKATIEGNQKKNVQIILDGNPNVVFQIILEAVRQNLNALIIIQDFCLCQNKFLIEEANLIIDAMNLKNKIKLVNMVQTEKIIQYSLKHDKTICIGNSSIYSKLLNKAENLEFIPYNIIEVYSDSEEYNEIKIKLFEFAEMNLYELDFYDDMDYEEAVEAINRDGYGFATLVLSKENFKIEYFRKNIKSKYLIINENPFIRIKLDLKI